MIELLKFDLKTRKTKIINTSRVEARAFEIECEYKESIKKRILLNHEHISIYKVIENMFYVNHFEWKNNLYKKITLVDVDYISEDNCE